MAVNRKPKILLFDLGGVIVPWVGTEALAASNNITHEQVAERFDSSKILSAYERGLVNDAEFLEELPRVFDLPDTDIAALWNSWVHSPYPGTLKALAELKTRYTLGCLSNTNSLHWTYLNAMFSLEEVFDYPFASHHLHEAKPDTACYLKALKIMEATPEDVWFFDDTLANIEAARALGLTAHHVDRTVGVLPILKELELTS